MKDVAIITYTTSKYRDVWPMHFGQLSIHASELKSYAFSDEDSKDIWNYEYHQLITYVEEEPYWKQYTVCL